MENNVKMLIMLMVGAVAGRGVFAGFYIEKKYEKQKNYPGLFAVL